MNEEVKNWKARTAIPTFISNCLPQPRCIFFFLLRGYLRHKDTQNVTELPSTYQIFWEYWGKPSQLTETLTSVPDLQSRDQSECSFRRLAFSTPVELFSMLPDRLRERVLSIAVAAAVGWMVRRLLSLGFGIFREHGTFLYNVWKVGVSMAWTWWKRWMSWIKWN